MKKKLLSSAMALLLVFSCCVLQYSFLTSAAEPYMCVGYIYQGHYRNPEDVARIDVTKVTHINYSFALINQQTYIPYLTETNILNRVRQKIDQENPSVKLMLSIGGWGAKGFCYAAQTEASRNAFAQECLNLINTYGFDGIDLDWEYPGGAWGEIDTLGLEVDRVNYTLLCRAIRNKIGNDKLLSIAGGASNVSGVEAPQMANILDFINIMTYDYGSENNADFNSTKNFVESWASAGFPRNKINVGIPLYGRQGNNWPTYQEIVNMKNNGGRLTTGASESYLMYNGNKVSFDSPEMIRNKMLWIKQQGYGGGMCWELSQDYNADLINVMWSNLNGDGSYQSPYMPIPGVVTNPLRISSVTKTGSGTVTAGDSITWNVSTTGGTGAITFDYAIARSGGAYETQLVSSSSSSFTYTTGAAGTYTLRVTAKDNNGQVIGYSSAVEVNPSYSFAVTANKTGTVTAGTPVSWMVSVTPAPSETIYYRYQLTRNGQTVENIQSTASLNYSNTPSVAGTYVLNVTASNSSGVIKSFSSAPITVTQPFTLANPTYSHIGIDQIRINASASGGSGAYVYSYYVIKDAAVPASSAYNAADSFTFEASGQGEYKIRVYCDDTGTGERLVKTLTIRL